MDFNFSIKIESSTEKIIFMLNFFGDLAPFPIEHRDKLHENLLNTEKKKNMKNSVALCGTSVNSVVKKEINAEKNSMRLGAFPDCTPGQVAVKPFKHKSIRNRN